MGKSFRQPRIEPFMMPGLVATAFLFCYSGVFIELAKAWWSNSIYSHGALVPLISLYIIWLKRGRLKAVEMKPRLITGALVMVFGLFLLMLGRAGKTVLFEEFSILITVCGAVALIAGKEMLKALFFPIAYLTFMIRFWDTFTFALYEPLQNFTAHLSSWMLSGMGIPVFRSSVFLELPHIRLEVAKECSGVNYLIGVVAIGLPVAYLSLDGWIRKTALVAGAVLIAILSNAVRVALIGILSFYGLTASLHGPYHALHAMLVFFAGFAAIFAGARLLSKGQSKRRQAQKHAASAGGRPAGRLRYAIALAILLSAGTYVNFAKLPDITVEAKLKDIIYSSFQDAQGIENASTEPISKPARQAGTAQ